MKSKNSTQLKRTLCLVMAIILAFGVFFNAAFVANATEERNDNFGGAPVKSESNWKYYSDGELVITGNIDDYSEENPAPWHQYAANIKTISIQEGITSIGAYAFCDFSGTSKIYIPGSVTHIGQNAFKNFSLTYVAFGGDVTAFNAVFNNDNEPQGVNVQLNHTHKDGATKHAKAADCKNDGYTGDIYCKDCGAFFKAGEVIKSTDQGHTWSKSPNFKVKREATCTTKGIKVKYCTKCGALFDEKDGTENVDWVYTPALGHDLQFNGEKISNCKTANSQVKFVCSRCSYEKFEKVNDHVYLYKVIDPSCTKEGYTHVTCKYCEKINDKVEITPALGHKPDKLVVEQEQSCTEKGIYKHVCSRPNCDYKLENNGEDYVDSITVVPALGHDMQEIIEKEPSCPVYDPNTKQYVETGVGTKVMKCVRPNCNYKRDHKEDYVDESTRVDIPNLHTEGSWSVTKYVIDENQPTCVNPGHYYLKCNICGKDIYVEDATANTTQTYEGLHNKTEEIAPTPNSHNASKWVTVKEPTCEENGLMIKKCTQTGCTYHGDFGENSPNPNPKAAAISKAIDDASDDRVVKAIIKTVDNAVADNVANKVLLAYYNLTPPSKDDIYTIIYNNFSNKSEDLTKFDETQKELAENIIKAAAKALAEDADADPTMTITRQLIIDYLSAAFDAIGEKWVADAVAAAVKDDGTVDKDTIDLIANVTLDSQIIAATGHKYEVVSYYRDVNDDNQDVYYPVTQYNSQYYKIIGYDKDDVGNYTPIPDIYEKDEDGNIKLDDDGNRILLADTSENVIPASKVVTEVDCNVGGTLVKQCPVCESINVTDVAKGRHSYIYTTIAPTCTEQGYTLQTCEFCTYRREYDHTPSIGHDWQDTVIQDSTCTKTGLQAKQCQNCKKIDKNTYQPVQKKDHDYSKEIIAPTCTNDGYTQYTCKVCGGGYRDQYVDAAGHDYEDIVTPVTCTTNGFTTHTCKVCGHEIKDDVVLSSGHQYGEAKEIPATCTDDAYTQQICTVCGEEKKTNIQFGSAYQHKDDDGNTTIVVDPYVAPTCTEDGLTTGSHCSRCNTVIEAQEVIPHSGHKVVDVAEQSATCTKAGHTNGQYCSVCGYIIQESHTIPAKGHTPNRSKATCTENKICTVCGATLEKAKGHTPSAEEYIKKEATAFRKGIKYRVCTVCGTSDGLEYEYSLTFIQKIVWIFTHFLDIILALLGRANNVF